MKKLSNLTGVKVLGKIEQKSIHGGGGVSASCGGDPCTGTYCTLTCNGVKVRGLCTSQGCQPL